MPKTSPDSNTLQSTTKPPPNLRRSERKGKYHLDVAAVFGNKSSVYDDELQARRYTRRKSSSARVRVGRQKSALVIPSDVKSEPSTITSKSEDRDCQVAPQQSKLEVDTDHKGESGNIVEEDRKEEDRNGCNSTSAPTLKSTELSHSNELSNKKEADQIIIKPADDKIEVKSRKRKSPIHESPMVKSYHEKDQSIIDQDVEVETSDVNGNGNQSKKPRRSIGDYGDYQCSKCPSKFESRVGLTNHLKLHGTKKNYPCEMCDFSCTNKKTMRQHKCSNKSSFKNRTDKTEKPLDKLFYCKKCPFSTDQIVKLQRHENKHVLKAEQQCPHCTYSCRSTAILNQHLRLHTPEKLTTSSNLTIDPISLVQTAKSKNVIFTAEKPGNPESNEKMEGITSDNSMPSTSIYQIQDHHDKQNSDKSEPNEKTKNIASVTGSDNNKPSEQTQDRLDIDIQQLEKSEYGEQTQDGILLNELNIPMSSATLDQWQDGRDIQEHVNSESDGNAQDDIFLNRSDIGRTSVEQDRRDILSCHLCPYKSKHGCDMKAHLKMHNEQRAYKCTRCSYSTMRQNALKAHEELHDGVQQPHLFATACGILGGQKSRLIKPLRTTNGKIIGDKFERENINENENNEVFYRCRFCPQEFSCVADLLYHSRYHFIDSETEFICDQCGFKTNLDGIFQKHKKAHELYIQAANFAFKCTECPAELTSYGKLWHHMQKHKKASRFPCDRCSFSAGSLLCLNEHIVVHQDHQDQEGEEVKCSEASVVKEDELKTKEQQITSPQKGQQVQTRQVTKEKAKGVGENNSPDKNDEPKRNDLTESSASTTSLPSLDNSFNPINKRLNKMMSSLPFDALKSIQVIQTSADKGIKTNHESSSRLRCKECPFETRDRQNLKLHSTLHRNSKDRPFKCNLCSFGCFSALSLHRHLDLHIKDREKASEAATTSNQSISQKKSNATETTFPPVYAHRKEHLRLLQQRLVTIIKRAANEEQMNGGRGLKIKRIIRKTDKMFNCDKCCFRCDSAQAFSGHTELHGNKSGTFVCLLCDYASQTKNTLIFHEQNHHIYNSLTDQVKSAAGSNPGTSTAVKPGFGCMRCNIGFFELHELGKHWDEFHARQENATKYDKELSLMLSMKMVPKS